MSQSVHPPRPLPRRLRLLLTAAAAAFLLLVLRRAVISLAFQILLAVLLAWAARPVAAFLEKRFPPGLSSLASLLFFLFITALFLYLLLPQLGAQLSLAVDAVPLLIDLAGQLLDRLAASSLAQRLRLSFHSSEELLSRLGSGALRLIPAIVQKAAGMGSVFMRAFLSPALAFYLLRDRQYFCFQLSLLIPLRHRKRTLSAFKEMRREIAGYFRGQLLISTAVALLTALSLLIIGVPAYLLLGICMGIFDLIPYLGPYLGAIPIVLFSLPLGLDKTLWAIVCVILVQQAESLFLSPYFMSGATGIHPAYVLLLLSAGGMIAGLPGMLFSLPLFVCLRGALRAFRCVSPEKSS